MIHLHITAEFEADAFGPHEVVSATVRLPRHFAEDAAEAHQKLLTLIRSEEYLELPTVDEPGFLALCSDTIKEVRVWEL